MAKRDPVLYGPDGRRVSLPSLQRERARPGWASLRRVWEGRTVASGLTPRRLVRILRDADQGDPEDFLELAERMEERDPHYAAVLGTRKRAVSGIDPVVEPATDSSEDRKIAGAVRGLARRPGFATLVKDCLDALGKGYSCIEIVWKRAAEWHPERYEWRDPLWFRLDIDDGRTLRLVDERDQAYGVELEPFKWIVHRPVIKSGLPVRGALGRLCAICWMCKAWAVTDWTGYAEIHGQPWRVGKYHDSATDEQIARLKGALANLGTDASAVIPESMMIELVSARGGESGTSVYETLARYLDQQMSKGVLGQTMTTDDGSSRSQAEVHDRVRQDIREDDARALAETLDRDLVRPYVDLNFGPREEYPRLLLPVPDSTAARTILEAAKDLVPLGLRVGQDAVRDAAGIPHPADDAELLHSPARPAEAPQRALPGPEAANRAAAAGLLEELEARAIDGWQPAMEPLLEPVRELARTAGTEDEFLAGLTDLLGSMDLSELVRALALATFQARGLGDARDEP